MHIRTVKAICPLCGPNFIADPIARGRDFEYGTTGTQLFEFVRCRSCSIILLDPRPEDSAIAGLYPEDYEPYRFHRLPQLVQRGRDLVQRRKIAMIARFAKSGARLVDVGTGGGALLRLLREHRPTDLQLIGWDFPGPHLIRLKEEGFEVIEAPLDRSHVPAGVDVFVLNQVIEHVPDPAELVRMLGAALKPGGFLIIETPNTAGLDARLFAGGHWGGYHIPRHMVLFDQDNLCTLVRRHGLIVVETARLASPAFWIQSLHHTAADAGQDAVAALFTLRNLPLVAGFAAFDAMRGCVAPTSNQRVVARKSA